MGESIRIVLGALFVTAMLIVLAIAVQPYYLTGQMILDNPMTLIRCPNFWAIIVLTIQYVIILKWGTNE